MSQNASVKVRVVYDCTKYTLLYICPLSVGTSYVVGYYSRMSFSTHSETGTASATGPSSAKKGKLDLSHHHEMKSESKVETSRVDFIIEDLREK